MCDEEDLDDTDDYDLQTKVKKAPLVPWRNLPQAVRRRKEDWTNVSVVGGPALLSTDAGLFDDRLSD